MIDEVPGLQARLVDGLKAGGYVRSAPVEAAFRTVPRHVFLPEVAISEAYTDQAFPTKHADGRPVSSSSQPAIMAIMLEQLALQPGQRVLEIGAGTGYNAALIARIVGSGGRVVAIDLDDDLVRSARQHLAQAGIDNVDVPCADGGYGWLDGAPYDRIILTASAWDIAPAWFDQLSPGGRLVIPLSLRHVQTSVAFVRLPDHLEGVSVAHCGFMPLRGAFAGPERIIPLGTPAGPSLVVDSDRRIDTDALVDALSAAPTEVSTGLSATVREATGSLSLWLALEDPDSCLLSIYGDPSVVDASGVPLLVEWPAGYKKQRSTQASLGREGLVALSRPPDDQGAAMPLSVVGFAADPELMERMRASVVDWHAAGRPPTETLRISAYPKGQKLPSQLNGRRVLAKRWTTLVISRA